VVVVARDTVAAPDEEQQPILVLGDYRLSSNPGV
jgi:hypothetical protein